MEQQTSITQLASTVLKLTSTIDDFLIQEKLPPPSLGLEAVPDLVLSDELQGTRQSLLATLEQLYALVSGPLPLLMRTIGPQVNIFISLQAIHRYRIAQNFSVDEEITYQDLALRCGLLESDARRILRGAIAHHVFCEPRKGVVAHNALSKLLLTIPYLMPHLGMTCDEMWASGPRTVDALQIWPLSEEPNHTGFALANGTGAGFFEVLSQEPERAKRFAESMKLLQSSPAYNINHLLDHLDWPTDCSNLVVDLAGSLGVISIELLRKFLNTRCIVQDMSSTIRKAQAPPDLNDRLSFQAHDIFQEQPVKGGDCYLLRSVLHNWPDSYASTIIKNLIPAMKPGAQIILNEICLPEPGTLPRFQEQMLRGYDLAMKQNCNGKERDRDDWASLIRQVDPRLRVEEIKSPKGSLLSVIKVRWDGPQMF